MPAVYFVLQSDKIYDSNFRVAFGDFFTTAVSTLYERGRSDVIDQIESNQHRDGIRNSIVLASGVPHTTGKQVA